MSDLTPSHITRGPRDGSSPGAGVPGGDDSFRDLFLSRLGRGPSRARNGVGRLIRGLRRRFPDSRPRTVPIGRLLLGDENGVRAAKIAWLFRDPLRPSRPIRESPHVKLLREYEEIGDRVFEAGRLERTDYYRNAWLNVDILGRYFEASTEEGIAQVARDFVAAFRGSDLGDRSAARGRSGPADPIVVRPIEYSDCYQVVDGHHRLAIACVRGAREISVRVRPDPVLTPLQSLLLEVLWLKGRRELYQPVDSPEVGREWVLIRRCTDRLAKMRAFLESRGLPAGSTYLDIGCSYGWFVAEMARLGFRAGGVERDPVAGLVGRLVYGLGADTITRADGVRFLRTGTTRYDVLSCFSVLHHFALGLGGISPEEFIRLLDRATGRVLFFDTGQGHEAWFRDTLKGWDADYIESWIKDQTSFTEVVRLGPDEDAVPPHQENYRRMLFACLR